MALNLLILGFIQQGMYKTIHDVDDLQKRWMQTWFDFDQEVIDTATNQWRDCLRSCVHRPTGNVHFKHLL